MSRHESQVRLRHMLDHAREAVAMAAGKRRKDLDSDRKLNLALVRLLEVVGEAASRTPADERTQYAQIPWAQIVGLRNRAMSRWMLNLAVAAAANIATRPARFGQAARAGCAGLARAGAGGGSP